MNTPIQPNRADLLRALKSLLADARADAKEANKRISGDSLYLDGIVDGIEQALALVTGTGF